MQRHKVALIALALAILMSSTLAIAATNQANAARAHEQATLAAVASQALGGNYNLNWTVMAGGGNTMSSASFRLKSTVGQPIVGTFSNENYRIQNGFWQNVMNQIETFLPVIFDTYSGE